MKREASAAVVFTKHGVQGMFANGVQGMFANGVQGMFASRRDRSGRQGSGLVKAPRVDYADYATFVDLYTQMHREYVALIEHAVALRRVPFRRSVSSRSWPFFSQRDLLLVGLAEFQDLRRQGLVSATRLTRQRGLRFALFLNESIVEAVTTACRTYINTLSGLRLLHEDIHAPVDYSMMTGLMVDSMYRASGQCDTHAGLIGTNLFDANFVQWATEESCLNIPRHVLPDCLLALAMLTHRRLGPWYATALGEDVLRLICRQLRQ